MVLEMLPTKCIKPKQFVLVGKYEVNPKKGGLLDETWIFVKDIWQSFFDRTAQKSATSALIQKVIKAKQSDHYRKKNQEYLRSRL